MKKKFCVAIQSALQGNGGAKYQDKTTTLAIVNWPKNNENSARRYFELLSITVIPKKC